MTGPRDELSYWLQSAPGSPYPALEGPEAVDVAVIGGGIAGLSTAWELIKAGRRVAVLDAGRVAAGVTGNTTAKVTAQHGSIFAHLTDSAGREAARLYGRSQLDAMAHLAAIVAELGVDCELEQKTAYSYSTREDQVGDLQAEAAAARDAGLPAAFVTETGLPFDVAGAVRVTGQAQFHPRRFLIALAEGIAERGGLIFEDSRVLDIEGGGPYRLRSANGEVTAADVVVTTGYPVFDKAKLFTRLTPRRELVLAAPIPAESDPDGMYVTSEDHMRSVRTAPYGDGRRLLIITGESFKPGEGDVAARFERLATWAGVHFGATGFRYRWAAQDNDTPDRLPFVGKASFGTGRVYVATGFGGWGMTNGVMSARLLTGLLTEDPRPWTDLYDPHRFHLREAVPILKAQTQVAKHFIGDRVDPPGEETAVGELACGKGTVLRVDGTPTAVYRDDDGSLHAVSAICTHLGCTVAFNDAERTWECPCHGSRFATDGTVLQGPANEPLDRRPLPEEDDG
ncbi:FAD-dependent oxidoreductase [Phytomonospora sp. NPDC050363]|uniref:FAD-dependent oxidoreductase n=1 Tax=Phytomonospora sp. NPDC050363 TaxID=3155642 RepID=UPI00340A07A3